MLLICSSSVPPEAFDKQSNGIVAHLEAKVESDELDRLNEIARAAVPTKGGGNDEEIGGGDEDENGVGEEEAEDDAGEEEDSDEVSLFLTCRRSFRS